MPFKSERQRRYLFAVHPDIARRWTAEEKRRKKAADDAHDHRATSMEPQDFSHLYGTLTGISDRSLRIHLGLYNKYVQDLAALEAEYPLTDWVPDRGESALLDRSLSSLELEPEGPLAEALEEILDEMRARGITFVPNFYLGDGDFWTTDRATSINIPWFLANEDLWRLANRARGSEYSIEDVKKCLRHEVGHALGYAYEVWKAPGWSKLFGDFDAPYREHFHVDPTSRDYVEYLTNVPEHYGQKHPDEDWAETFAAWLDPESDWRDKYHGAPAINKLEWWDHYAPKVILESPIVTRPGRPAPYFQLPGTVRQALGLPATRSPGVWSEHAALLRREPYLYNAVRLHELYFQQFRRDASPSGRQGNPVSTEAGMVPEGLRQAARTGFGSWESYLLDLRAVGAAVDNGWALTCWDPRTRRIRNALVEEHRSGVLGDCPIVLAMDVWQHAYMPDYGARRDVYLGAFFRNVDWSLVESRLLVAQGKHQALPSLLTRETSSLVSEGQNTGDVSLIQEQSREMHPDARYAGGPGGATAWEEEIHPRNESGKFVESTGTIKTSESEVTKKTDTADKLKTDKTFNLRHSDPDAIDTLGEPTVDRHFQLPWMPYAGGEESDVQGGPHPMADLHPAFVRCWQGANPSMADVAKLGELMAGNKVDANELCESVRLRANREDLTPEQLAEFGHEYYNATQAVLARKGYQPDDTITLYRGVTKKQLHGIQIASVPGQKVNLGVNALSSWTTSAPKAEEFGAVLKAEVPIKNIFAKHDLDVQFAHPNYGEEQEVVLYHPDHVVKNAEIMDYSGNTDRWIRAHQQSRHFYLDQAPVTRTFNTRHGVQQATMWIKPEERLPGDVDIRDIGHLPVGRDWAQHKYGMPDQTIYSPANFTQTTGKITPERQKLHDEIKAKFLNVLKPREEHEKPVAILTMGGPASGKGAIVSKLPEEFRHGAVLVDADEVKLHIPEYKEAVEAHAQDAAFMVHEESSNIAHDILHEAIQQKQNIILDSTGKNATKFAGTIKKLQDAGYHVHLMMVDRDEALAKAGLMERAERSGRWVPDEVFNEAYGKMHENFNQVARLADESDLYDGVNLKVVWHKTADGSEGADNPEYLKSINFKH